jgi:tRNA threonylcarbamoyladenosine biosynthesis protein TsaE
MTRKSGMTDLPATTWAWLSTDEAATARFGRALGAAAEPGTVVALVGNLGAGKTRLVQGIAAGLEISGQPVNSPTFILVHEYTGRLPVYHFDTYRLRTVDEFLDLGAEEYLSAGGVCLIEWADRVAEVLPPDCLRIEIEIAGPTARQFRLTASGPQSAALLERLRRNEALADTPQNERPA